MRDSINTRLVPAGCLRACGSVMSAASLIAAVHRRRPLWDPTDVHHHNRLVVAALWNQIGYELGINSMLAKSKWRGLRDYYRQQLKRAMEQPESAVSSSWAHFDEMSFLGPSMSAAASRSFKAEEDEDMGGDETGGGESAKWSPPPWLDEEAAGDEDDLLFFRSLLPDLRGLPRPKKAWVRLQIQRLVCREVYGRGGPGSPQSAGSPPASPPPPLMPCKVEIASDHE